jgi:hypothetical protein
MRAGSVVGQLALMAGRHHEPFQFHVVTKSDVGLDAPYVVGVFTNAAKARNACIGAGRFIISRCDPNRLYPRGTLLDCALIDNVTTGSLKVGP